MERVLVSFSLCFSPSGEDANGQWNAEETDSRGEDKQKPESWIITSCQKISKPLKDWCLQCPRIQNRACHTRVKSHN